MTPFEILKTRLDEIYGTWNSREEKVKKQKINLILPFVQLAGYIDAIEKISPTSTPGNNSSNILQDFDRQYQIFYKQNLTQLKSSDIAPELFEIITQVQKEGKKLSASEREELLKYEDKYTHAHSRIMRNYGKFLEQIFPHLEEERRGEIYKQIAEVQNSEDTSKILSTLAQINDSFELEKRSAIIAKDDLENHALLNQMTSYVSNLRQIPEILLDENSYKEALEIFNPQNEVYKEFYKSEIKREKTSPDFNSFRTILEEKSLEMTVGFESEFLLTPISQDKDDEENITKQNIALKKILADLNSRRKMQTKYGFEPTIPEIENTGLFFLKDSEEHSRIGVIGRSDFNQIVTDLKENRIADRDKIDEMVKNFTEAEGFFYKLFFLSDFTSRHRIEVDGVFDPNKTKAENLETVWSLIEKNRFHEKLLDMIQAYEISVGPFDISEALQNKNSAFEEMRLLAVQSGVSLEDPNIQINSAFTIQSDSGEKENILLPKIIKENGIVEIKISQLAVEFLRLMEEAVADLAVIPGILRQEAISTSLDRNKFVAADLQNTEFRQVNEKLPAFLNHKILAAKNSSLRLSFINNEVAVVELRLVGNNTHFAKFSDAQTIQQSGIDFIGEKFLSRVTEKIEQFVTGKTKEEIKRIFEQKVPIDSQGRIQGLEPLAVEKIERDKIFDLDAQESFNPNKPALSVALTNHPIKLSTEDLERNTG